METKMQRALRTATLTNTVTPGVKFEVARDGVVTAPGFSTEFVVAAFQASWAPWLDADGYEWRVCRNREGVIKAVLVI